MERYQRPSYPLPGTEVLYHRGSPIPATAQHDLFHADAALQQVQRRTDPEGGCCELSSQIQARPGLYVSHIPANIVGLYGSANIAERIDAAYNIARAAGALRPPRQVFLQLRANGYQLAIAHLVGLGKP